MIFSDEFGDLFYIYNVPLRPSIVPHFNSRHPTFESEFNIYTSLLVTCCQSKASLDLTAISSKVYSHHLGLRGQVTEFFLQVIVANCERVRTYDNYLCVSN